MKKFLSILLVLTMLCSTTSFGRDMSSNKGNNQSSYVFSLGDSKDIAITWAEALKQNRGDFRFATLSYDLKTTEANFYENNNWKLGDDKHWVVSYNIINESIRPFDNTNKYTISYIFTDDTNEKYAATESITLQNAGYTWQVIQHDNYTDLPTLVDTGTKFDTAVPKNIDNILPSNDKESTVDLWARGLMNRSSCFRFALLTPKLKVENMQSYFDYYFVIGGSSPWVVNYTITQTSKIDENNYNYHIEYLMFTSDPQPYVCSENVSVSKIDNNWYISKIEPYSYYPDDVTDYSNNLSTIIGTVSDGTMNTITLTTNDGSYTLSKVDAILSSQNGILIGDIAKIVYSGNLDKNTGKAVHIYILS